MTYPTLDSPFPSPHGFRILQSLRQAKGFNRWMLSQCRPFIGERVLNAGCGIGNFTEQLLDRSRLLCADHDAAYIDLIERRFNHLKNVQALRIDLAQPSQYAQLAHENIDTILCLNVLEHIDADTTVLANYHRTLIAGGHAIILVPAHRWLYGPCDQAIGHFRRYAVADLKQKMTNAGFEVVRIRQFNRLGAWGWLINKWLGRRDLNPRQMRLFECLLLPAKIIDFLRIGPGLSIIAIGRKDGPGNAPKKARP